MTKHTPGPWHVKPVHGEANYSAIVLKDGKGGWVVVLQHNGEAMPERQQADARLIAAAPTLLHRLRARVRNCTRCRQTFCHDCIVDRALLLEIAGEPCQIHKNGPPTHFVCATHDETWEPEDEGFPEQCPKGRD